MCQWFVFEACDWDDRSATEQRGQELGMLVSEREALFQASGPEGPAASKFLERLKIWPVY